MNTALVLDGDLKSALAAVRSLGANKIPVVAAAKRPTAMALHSRFVQDTFLYECPQTNPEAFFDSLLNKLKTLKIQTGLPVVVYAFSDATTLMLFENYEKLKELILFPMPPVESIDKAFDKDKTSELAKDLDIPVMPSLAYEARHTFDYPVVIKNRHSIVWQWGVGKFGTAGFVFSPQELKEKYEEIKKETDEAPLVQEFVTGLEYGVEMLVADGEILSQFTHKRIRSLSPRGGAAVVKKTASRNEQTVLMEQYASQIVRHLSWNGPVMIEFKVDDKENKVRLMEINGRFWGSLPLAEAAGVDFVFDYYKWLTQGVLGSAENKKTKAMRTIHFMGSCKWLMAVLFKKDKIRRYLYPNRTQALIDFMYEPFIATGDIFSWYDPIPSWYEVLDIIKR